MIRIEEDIELCRFDGVGAVAVYKGSMTNLVKADLKWRKADGEFCKALEMDAEVLKLSEIAEQLSNEGLITIVIDEPLKGKILQYGNYLDNKWYEIGTTCGYA